LELAVEGQFPREAERAFEFNARVEDVLNAIICCHIEYWITYFLAARAGSGGRTPSTGRIWGAGAGATLLGFTSLLPTKVTPSSMISFADRTSPNSSVRALRSILSLAVTLPLILPRTTADWTLMLTLVTASSPRLRVPSEWMSPSSLPSKV